MKSKSNNKGTSLQKTFGVLGVLYRNSDIAEICVDAPDTIYYSEKGQVKKSKSTFKNAAEFSKVIANIFALAGRKTLSTDSINHARLSDGTQLTAVLPPLSLRGPSLVITKLPSQAKTTTFEHLKQWNAIDDQGIALLRECITGNKNILMGYSPNSGITTFVNCFIQLIPENWRVAAIEKNASIVSERKQFVHLETRKEDAQALFESYPTLRFDYSVIHMPLGGEVTRILELLRDGFGSLTTISAEDPMDALKRLEAKCLQAEISLPLADIRHVISRAYPMVAMMKRGSDGVRRMDNLSQVSVDSQGRFILKVVYHYNQDAKKFEKVS